LIKVAKNKSHIDFSAYKTVFCDSLQALEWAYKRGLHKSAIIKTSAPAMLWGKKKNIHNIEARWTTDELGKFQGTIQKLTEDVFDTSLGVSGVERELALAISKYSYNFQKFLYKAACLDESDFIEPRLFIYVDGKTGSADNMMNSPWDKLLSINPLFSMVNYTLKHDRWNVLNTQGVSSQKRFQVAGYETIIYRMAVKIMKILPDFIFTKEILMPNENELNIEIASSLALHGVKISKIQLGCLSNVENAVLGKTFAALDNAVSTIMQKRVGQWLVPSSVELAMGLFKQGLKEEFKKFMLLESGWEKSIAKSVATKRKLVVLANAPGNIRGRSLSSVCRKNNIPLVSSQHGITIEISKATSMLHVGYDNSVADVIFSYNSKTVEIEKKTYFAKSKHYVVGMPMRLIRMKNVQIIDKSSPPIVYISLNLYHKGFSLSQKTDYKKAREEQDIITNVLNKLPHKVRYKTYPEDSRRYADQDPVLSDVMDSDNIILFDKKTDMRYLVSEHRILVTTCATSTLGWPVMSKKPVIFINQKYNFPLTDDAYVSMSKGIFVFNDDEKYFHKKLKDFLSQPIDEIERLWQEKKNAREDMIKEYFSAYTNDAGKRASKIILKQCF
jgi:hypothetical protein